MIHRGLIQALLAITVTLTLAIPVTTGYAAQTDARLAAGSGSFTFPFTSAGRTGQIRVFYHKPDTAGPDATVVFVMHGTGRNGESYRRAWIPVADERRFVLLVPEFSRAEFKDNYNLERLTTSDSTPIPQTQWPYQAIENIFDTVRAANSLSASTYDIYGHSAGGQFVHRLVLLLPEARYRVAVAANAGWYTMPGLDTTYPYGLGTTSVAPAQLARALGRKVIVLLGNADIDPLHPQLRRAPEAMVQGAHRFARGHAFFEQGKRTAAALNTPFEWQLQIAPEVAHSNRRMAPHAAPFVGGRE